MGVNARDGVLSFLNVRSAEKAASNLWGVDKPEDADLPRLRKMSDIA